MKNYRVETKITTDRWHRMLITHDVRVGSVVLQQCLHSLHTIFTQKLTNQKSLLSTRERRKLYSRLADIASSSAKNFNLIKCENYVHMLPVFNEKL